MNRLILIGNGFDLAHGLLTGYNDFIVWYIKQALNQTLENEEPYNDGLLMIKFSERVHRGRVSQAKISTIIEELYAKDDLVAILDNRFPNIADIHGGYSCPFLTLGDPKLLRALLSNCNKSNWVDIENEYYQQLIKVLDKKDYSTRLFEVNALNASMRCLVSYLKMYLSTLPEAKPVPEYIDIFDTEILFKDVHNPPSVALNMHHTKDGFPESTLVLNFNYTSTLNQYPTLFNRNDIDITHIHGRAAVEETALIFGFGDELDSNYSRIENEQVKGFFNYMKSFGYFKTSRYRELVRFIDSGPFQVIILGHSCGLSDRTMLNMIFEHDYCWSIKVYYHNRKDGTNNYTELTHEISRHFNNKAQMRVKVVDFEASTEMPQF